MQVPIAPAHNAHIEEAEESLPAAAVAARKLRPGGKPSTPTSLDLYAHAPHQNNGTDDAIADSVSSGATAALAGHGHASAYTLAVKPTVDPLLRFRTSSMRIADGLAPWQPGSTTAIPSPATKSGHLVLYRLSGEPYFAASESQPDSTEPGRHSVSEAGGYAAGEVEVCPADMPSEDLQPLDGHVVDMRPPQQSSLPDDELNAGLSHSNGTGSMHHLNENDWEEAKSLTDDSTLVTRPGAVGRETTSPAAQDSRFPPSQPQGDAGENVTPQRAELQQTAAPVSLAVLALSGLGDTRKGVAVDDHDHTANGLVICCRLKPAT